jgi:hypothetical protein
MKNNFRTPEPDNKHAVAGKGLVMTGEAKFSKRMLCDFAHLPTVPPLPP